MQRFPRLQQDRGIALQETLHVHVSEYELEEMMAERSKIEEVQVYEIIDVEEGEDIIDFIE